MAGQFVHGILDVSDLNDIKKTGAWSIVDANLNVKNNPTRYGVLLSFYIGGQYPWLQMTMQRTGGAIQYRTCSLTNEWSEWFEG